MSTIAFLGCGSMGEAVLSGVIAAGTNHADIRATAHRTERAAELASRHSIAAAATAETPSANADAARGASIVVLGVAPGQITELAREIAPALSPDAVIVSLAAAVTIERLEAALPEGQPVVRTMPNTPVGLGLGVVSVTGGHSTSPGQLAAVRELFESVGTVVEIEEGQIDALSAISGSGPAYVFYLAEAMRTAGVDLGLDPELAATLANRTVAGAGAMLAEDGTDASSLLRGVASPNGTTQKAIDEFDARRVAESISRGTQAAASRAAEISAEL